MSYFASSLLRTTARVAARRSILGLCARRPSTNKKTVPFMRMLLSTKESPIENHRDLTFGAPSDDYYDDQVLADHLEYHHHASEEIPPEDYYDGHLLVNHLEFLEDMIEHTDILEKNLEELKKKHDEMLSNKNMNTNIKWMDANDINALLEPTLQTKSLLRHKLQKRKHQLQTIRQAVFAVDSPDGESDGRVQEEMMEIQHIFEEAARLENAKEILEERALNAKVFAVDAPNGESDGDVRDEVTKIQDLIDNSAKVSGASDAFVDEPPHRHQDWYPL